MGAFGVLSGLRTRWQILNDQSPHEHDEAVSGSLFVSQANLFSATPVSIHYAFAKIDRSQPTSVSQIQIFGDFSQLHRRTL
jgi:hypothetical protein